MRPQSLPCLDAVRPLLRPVDDRLFGWIGRLFVGATLVGLGLFGVYIALRASGATIKNFEQWRSLVAGLPMPTVSAWIANLGTGMHFAMGAALVLAWPILLSARVRSQHRKVHRWTGHNSGRLGMKGARERHEHIQGHIDHGPKVHAWLDRFLGRWVKAELTID